MIRKDGKVLLPELNSEWTPAMGLRAILDSLQVALSGRPFSAEDWSATTHRPIIYHQSIKATVLEGLEEGGSMATPSPIRQAAKEIFWSFYNHYRDVCEANLDKDGKKYLNPCGNHLGIFQFGHLLRRLEDLKTVLDSQQTSNGFSMNVLNTQVDNGNQPPFMLHILEDEETTTDIDIQSKTLSLMLHRAQIDLPPPSYKHQVINNVASITTFSLTLNRDKKIAEAPGAPESPRKRTKTALPQEEEMNAGVPVPPVASPPMVPESTKPGTSSAVAFTEPVSSREGNRREPTQAGELEDS